jgi:hypothetical protein
MHLYATLLKARLTAPLLLNSTTFTVDNASLLPALSGGQYFVIDIVEGPTKERVYATARTSNTFTVIRGREGTSHKQFDANALVVITIDPYGFDLSSGGAVDSVNGQTGAVVLDADDISDTSSAHKFTTAADKTKLAGIASGAQVNTVASVNTKTGSVVINPDDLNDSTTTNKFVTAAEKTKLSNLSGVNSGDQTSIVGISGTKAQFNTAVSDGDILFVGDVSAYTDEMAQDAIGVMVGTSIVYNDAAATLQRAALTGDITASQDSNTTTIANNAVSYAKMQNVTTTDKILGRASAGTGVVEEITCTSAGRNLIDDADTTAQRATLGLGTLATQSGTFTGASSGTNTGDQTITLTGDVTGTGTGSFATTIATPALATVAVDDKVIIKDTSASDNTKYVTAQSIADLHTDAVSSVNAKSGVVVLNTDDLSDSTRTNKFTTASDKTKLAGIAAGAQVNTVNSVNTQTGSVVLTQDNIADGTTYKQYSATDKTKLAGISAGADVTGTANILSHIQISRVKAVSTTQSVTAATFTKAQLSSVSWDVDSGFDATTNYRYTPNKAGKWLVNVGCNIAAPADQNAHILALYKNGASIENFQLNASGTTAMIISTSFVVSMNGTTDYIELYIWRAATGNVTAAFLAGTYLGA